MKLLPSTCSNVSEAAIKNCFRKVKISKKLAEEAISDQDDRLKNLPVEELKENISDVRESLPDEVTEELNATVLLDIDAKLSANGDKPSGAEILAEIQEEVVQKEEIHNINVA